MRVQNRFFLAATHRVGNRDFANFRPRGGLQVENLGDRIVECLADQRKESIGIDTRQLVSYQTTTDTWRQSSMRGFMRPLHSFVETPTDT